MGPGQVTEADRSLYEYAKLRFDIAGHGLAGVPSVRAGLRAYHAELTPAVLDSEYRIASAVLALPTAAPYLDLDPAFIHRK